VAHVNQSERRVTVSVDSEADAAYIAFPTDDPTRSVKRTIPIHDDEGLLVGAVDLDATGRSLGVELLRASQVLPASWLHASE
jgi:uncharacterized protein YuzE